MSQVKPPTSPFMNYYLSKCSIKALYELASSGIILFRCITMLCGTGNIMHNTSPHSVWIWGVFYRIISVPHDNVMSLNNVTSLLIKLSCIVYCISTTDLNTLDAHKSTTSWIWSILWGTLNYIIQIHNGVMRDRQYSMESSMIFSTFGLNLRNINENFVEYNQTHKTLLWIWIMLCQLFMASYFKMGGNCNMPLTHRK